MAIQMIQKVRYSPARDVYHILPRTVQTVCEHLIVGQPFKPLHALLESLGVTDADLEQAAAAYVKFMQLSQTEQGISFTDALERSGWLSQRPLAQIGVMYYMGVIQSGLFYEGAQFGFTHDQEQTTGMEAMIQAGIALAEYVHAPWWKRWWIRRKYQRQSVVFRG